jgi:hypothetical protein
LSGGPRITRIDAKNSEAFGLIRVIRVIRGQKE